MKRLPDAIVWAGISLAIAIGAFAVSRDLGAAGDPAQAIAQKMCASTTGCMGAEVDPDTLEGRVAQFTMAGGQPVTVLLVFKDDEFLGTIPLE